MRLIDTDTDIDNPSTEPHFQTILAASLKNPSRRQLIRGAIGLAGLGLLSDSLIPFANATTGTNAAAGLGFTSVQKSLLDSVQLPVGYSYKILHASGDPLTDKVPAFSNQGLELDDWSARIGDQHDGMDIFYIDEKGHYTERDTGRALLVVNHESSAESHLLHPKGQTSNGKQGKKFDQFGAWDLGVRPELEVLKEINLHGVSIVEMVKGPQGWSYRLDSPLNRRLTAQTPMPVTGPQAELKNIQALMMTAFDPKGEKVRGTLNNCGHGKTPWGTYLTCEENWAKYFQIASDAAPLEAKSQASLKRYGVVSAPLNLQSPKASSQGWHTVSATDDRFTRWNLAASGASATQDFRNEANTFGFIVEIDPVTRDSVAAKRVALGRFAHEAAVCGTPKIGEPLAFYMGCDTRNEYIYKFVSTALWDPKDVGGGMAVGDKYLNEGKLFVAQFKADGTGQWLELTLKDPKIASNSKYMFANQADVLVNARLAADAVGATPMDRPEWGAVNHKNGEIYFALTNSDAANRNPAKVDAANPRAYTDVDGKKSSGNPNGHIIRFHEQSDRSTALQFQWDIFLFGAEEDAGSANLSGLTASNSFSSPDGLWFSKATGICWIQTDDAAMTDETNCMMLAAIPGQVGDGGKVTVNNKMVVAGQEQTSQQETFIGAALGDAKLRRFLVCPTGAEVTGVTETADGKTLFVNIQHPGELTPALGETAEFKLQSRWPGNAGYGVAGRPRSATIVITKDDGGVVGL
ncbi:MAG: PhoX family phosphatase [Alcaligenaceae bacterium]